MLRFTRANAFFVGAAALLAATGCGSQPAKPTAPASSEQPADHDHGDHEHGDHDHAELGPHGGQLIELGEEEYHAELLHDDQMHKVTIYVLDGKAAETVPVSAPEVTIQLEAEGKPQRFALAAVHLDQENPSQAICFETTNEELSHALDEEGAKATLTIDVNGREFTGAIVHEHEHDHKHSDEAHGEHRE